MLEMKLLAEEAALCRYVETSCSAVGWLLVRLDLV